MDALMDVGREFEIAGQSLNAIEAGKMSAILRQWYHAPNAAMSSEPKANPLDGTVMYGGSND